MQRKVFIAIPTLNGQLAAQTESALDSIKIECAGLGWGVEEFRWVGDSLIVHARNVIAARFLESDCTDIFWLDSDVGFAPGVFTRLMSHRVDFVAGVYRVKSDDERYAVRWPLEGELWADPTTGLLEAQDVPFGCVRMSRLVLMKMRDSMPEDWFTAQSGANGLKCWLMFNTEVRDNQFWGEDFYFCRKWRELGGKVWIDPELPLVHVNGEGKVYAGNLGEFLRSKIV